jgi:hypothetical protein
MLLVVVYVRAYCAATASFDKNNTSVTYSWYNTYPPAAASASMFVSVAMDAKQTVVPAPTHTMPEHATQDARTTLAVITPTVAFTRCSQLACPHSRGMCDYTQTMDYTLHANVSIWLSMLVSISIL